MCHILIADAREQIDSNVWALEPLLAQASPDFKVPRTNAEDMALLHFTSGTTGMPKGAIHVHNAALMHYITGKYVLDLHPDDVFWCTADPGWVTGTSYGIIAPLLHGVTNLIDEGDFDAERWYGVLEKQKVTVWYTAPTAIRMLMRVPGEPRSRYNLSTVRLIASVGEPLNPSAVVWGQQTLGLPIHDNWWQTETGGIMIANFPSMEIRPGSMGKASAWRRGRHRAAFRTESSRLSRSRMKRESWRSDQDGRPCFAAICMSRSATRSVSSKTVRGRTGILPATWRAAMRMATSPSWAAPMTSSRPPVTWWGHSKWKAR